jgi:hypothetical protein
MDNRERLAAQLVDFIAAVHKKENESVISSEPRESIARVQKDRPSIVSEKCVGKLTDEECGHLDRILEKMKAACIPYL